MVLMIRDTELGIESVKCILLHPDNPLHLQAATLMSGAVS